MSGLACPAQWRCVRDPKSARLLDGRGEPMMDLPIQGDAVQLDVPHNDLLQMRVDFS